MAFSPDTPYDIKRGKGQVSPQVLPPLTVMSDTNVTAPAPAALLRRPSLGDLYNQAQVAQADPYGGFVNYSQAEKAPTSDLQNLGARLRRGMPTSFGDLVAPVVAALPGGEQILPQVKSNIAATVAPATPNKFANVDLTTPAVPAGTERLGKALPASVSRYAIGGDVGGPNAAKVYITRGKDGSTVVSQDADYAARNSAGKLRRGDVNAQVLANSQIDPRSGYEYATPTTRLSDNQIAQLPEAGLAQALADAQSAAAKETRIDPRTGKPVVNDLGLADTIQANQLRARLQSMQQSDAANQPNLSPRDQIALFRAQTSAQQGAERNDIARGAAGLAAKREARASFDDFTKNYNAYLQAGDSTSANALLANRLDSVKPADIPKYLDTDEGKFVYQSYLNTLRKGAENSLLPTEFIDERNIPQLSAKDIVLDKNGGFAGFRSPDQDAGDDPQYPVRRGLIRSIGGLRNRENYDPSIYNIKPATLLALQKYDQDN